MFKTFIAVFILAFASLRVEASKCEGNPKVIDACFVVHGRATFGPGTPSLRIWPIGTRRMLGVTAGPIADDADTPIAPKIVLRFDSGSERVFGDFEVCPFTTEQKGKMQMVCIQSVSKVVVER